MSVAAGTRLGPYEVLGLIGAGGMGEVYKARDTRLDRTVAIKILPSEIAADHDRRARFEREAKTIAGLTHPHICTMYDIGDHGGAMFLVMEHLEGETLAHRIEKGPLPIDQALEYGAQISEALAVAHRAGIVHRDLKPGNVMLTKSGAKLLDFGLAKLTGHGEQAAAAQVVSVPTHTAPLTADGVIVGTLQYMAPEQLEGKPADARTDLWALGAIVYEMVSGKRAFDATSTASLIGAILERQPEPLITRQPLTPRALDAIVRDCLAKAAEGRPDTAHDVARELRVLRDTLSIATSVSGTSGGGGMLRTSALVIACGALIGIPVFLGLRLSPEAPTAAIVRSELRVAPAAELNAGGATSTWLPTPGGSRTAIAWTSDGRSLVFVGRRQGTQQLYVRALDSPEARPLAGTDGAQLPVVSAPGESVAFWSDGALKQVPLGGGPVMELVVGVPVPPKRIVTDARGRLFFDKAESAVKQNEAVWMVQPGETAAPVTRLREVERSHVPSSVLPGDRTLLYTARKRIWTWGDEDVVAHDLASGKSKVLLHDAVDGRYVPTGHLVFLRRGVLFAVPFDAERVEVTGAPVAVVEGVAQALAGSRADDVTGAGQFAIASSGSLAWIPGTVAVGLQKVLVTVDRRGRVSTLPSPKNNYGPGVRLSPDATQLATTVRDLGAQSLWLLDLTRGVLTPLHRQGETYATVWSPDGRQVYFEWLDGGRLSLVAKSTDARVAPNVLASGEFEPSCWAPAGDLLGVLDGRQVAVASRGSQHSRIEPLLRTSDIERWPEISPDGRWLAYGSNASGRFEIYLQPYPGPGVRTLVSTDGGQSPVWDPSGRKLLFLGLTATGKGRMMASAFEPGSPPRVGVPRLLFEFDPTELRFFCTQVRCYDLSRDGERFYVTRTPTVPPAAIVTHINIVLNWFEELKAKVPVGK